MIIYNKQRKDGKASQEVLTYLDQLFVNYSYLDNKFIKYANDMAIVNFTKYLFRTVPAVVKFAVKNPLTTGLYQGAQVLTGQDISDPLDNYFDFVDTLFSRVNADPEDILSKVFLPSVSNVLDF